VQRIALVCEWQLILVNIVMVRSHRGCGALRCSIRCERTLTTVTKLILAVWRWKTTVCEIFVSVIFLTAALGLPINISALAKTLQNFVVLLSNLIPFNNFGSWKRFTFLRLYFSWRRLFAFFELKIYFISAKVVPWNTCQSARDSAWYISSTITGCLNVVNKNFQYYQSHTLHISASFPLYI